MTRRFSLIVFLALAVLSCSESMRPESTGSELDCFHYEAALRRVNQVYQIGWARDVVIRDRYALVASWHRGLSVVDIQDPEATEIVTVVPLSGNESQAVVLKGDHAFVLDARRGLFILDVSDIRAPAVVGSLATPGFSMNLAIKDDYAYIASWKAGVTIVDISESDSPVLIGTLETPGIAHDVVIRGVMPMLPMWRWDWKF